MPRRHRPSLFSHGCAFTKLRSLRDFAWLTGLLTALGAASEAGAEVRFSSHSKFAVGDAPSFVAIADLDGDGIRDLVTANAESDDLSVLLGNGDGSFRAVGSFAVGDRPSSVAVADLNRDGNPDLAAANAGAFDLDSTGVDSVSVLLGNGDGTFQAAASFAVGDRPSSVAVADLDGDGTLDLVTANAGASFSSAADSVSVLRGHGDGSFQAAASFAVGDRPSSVAVADLNGDGILDLVTANSGDSSADADDVSVLLGKGDGAYEAAASFAAGHDPISVTVSDLDGDGAPDLITANLRSDDVSVLLGHGDGSFQIATSFAAGDAPHSVAAADLDGDTIPDLVTSSGFREVNALMGNGDGGFRAAASFGAGDLPLSVAVADLDGDTIPDLVTANSVSDDVSVLRGNGDGTFQATGVFVASDTGLGAVVVGDLDGDDALDLVVGLNTVLGNDALLAEVNVLLGNGDGRFQAASVMGSDAISSVTLADLAVADLNGDTVLDLVTANGLGVGGRARPGEDVSVLLGNGDGTFQAAAKFTVGEDPISVAVADLDGDEIPDLVTANRRSADVSVLLGHGDGHFGDAASFSAGGVPNSVAVADFDGDSLPDVVIANGSGDQVSVLRGNGDGSLQAATSFAAGDGPRSVAVADLDGDGFHDLVTANDSSGDADGVSVLLGNGDGTFAAAAFFAAGNLPFSVAVADLDGDRVPDLATANAAGNDVSVLVNNGDGSFQTAISFMAGMTPASIAAADFDGDGRADLVTANNAGGNVTVLTNQSDFAVHPELDIKPGSDSNPIRLTGRGNLPVAILGSETFDVTDIDAATLAFGPAAASPAQDLSKSDGFADHLEDVNGDGLADLISHYRISDSGILPGDTSACLVGRTHGGKSFEACDSIRVTAGRRALRR